MKKPFRFVASGGLLLLLAACGGGIGSDDEEPGGGTPVPLATKADALRELSVVAELSGVLQGFSADEAGGGAAPKAACPLGGEEEYGTGTADYRFNYFDTQLRPVSYSRTVQRLCTANGSSVNERYSLDGFREDGVTATAGDGSQLQYRQIGINNTPRTTIYQQRSDGTLVYQSEEQQLGTLQQYVKADGNRERRLVFRYVLDDSEDNGILAAIGEAGSPFIIKDLDGVESFYAGRYAYETSETGCKGEARVSTLAAITRNAGSVTGGRLQFDAGDKRAVISFAADGTGSLQLNGAAAIALTAQEISKALAGSDCIPD
jgi:hypothetical protein